MNTSSYSLKRVLVSDGERVVMEENLELALEALFGKSVEKEVVVEEEEGSEVDLIAKAQDYYELVEASMKEGDWAGIGDNLDKLGDVLGRIG